MRKPRGCNAGVAIICWRRSGDALMRTKGAPEADEGPFIAAPAVTAMLAWVRGFTRGSAPHAIRHTSQLQFHCGKPPPAAEPSIKAERRPMRRPPFPESPPPYPPPQAGEGRVGADQNGPNATMIRTRPEDS